jgi:hypothetical protein
MGKIISFILATLLPFVSMASIHKMDLSDALRRKVVQLSAVNFSGQYTGRSVRLTVSNNNKKDSLDLTVNLGIILKPDDATCQPMVLAGEEELVLAPGKKGETEVQVFCGNAPRHCPSKNLRYTYLGLGSDTLITVLRFIHDSDLYDYLGQTAVWAIVNEHSLSGVYSTTRDALSKKLIDVICMATGRPHPDYYAITEQHVNPGEAAYTPKTMKIVAQFNVNLRTPTIMTAAVFDDKDHMIETIFERKLIGAGVHRLDAMFDAEAYGHGKYSVRLMNAERTLQEKKVQVEP